MHVLQPPPRPVRFQCLKCRHRDALIDLVPKVHIAATALGTILCLPVPRDADKDRIEEILYWCQGYHFQMRLMGDKLGEFGAGGLLCYPPPERTCDRDDPYRGKRARRA